MRKWHRDGFSPAEAVRYTIPICQPSLRDYDRQIETWKGEISDDEKRMAKLHRDRVADHPWNEGSYRQLETNVQGIKRKISTAESFIADGRHYLGKVWAGSGRRLTAQQRTLDWGLIEMKSGRVGSNIVSLVEIWKSKLETDSLVSSYRADSTTRESTEGQVLASRSWRWPHQKRTLVSSKRVELRDGRWVN